MKTAKQTHTNPEADSDTTPAPSEIPEATLLEELASDGAPLEDVDPARRIRAAEFWMQKFLENGVRPSLDVVGVYMNAYRSMWQRLNKGKTWTDRQDDAHTKAQHWCYIVSAILAASACSNTPKINDKDFETARRLLRHFGIPGCEDLTIDTIRQVWNRHRVRPDDDLIDIFVYAQVHRYF